MGKRRVFGEFEPTEKKQLEEELLIRYPIDQYPEDIEIEGHASGSVTVTKGGKAVNGFPVDYDFADKVNTALKLLANLA